MSKEVKLANSKRRHEKRTYTPLILPEPEGENNSDALGLAAQVRSLMMNGPEYSQLLERVKPQGQRAALDVINDLGTAVSAAGVLAAASSLTSVSTSDLQSVSETLGEIRAETMNNLANALRKLDGDLSSESAYSRTYVPQTKSETPHIPPSLPATAAASRAEPTRARRSSATIAGRGVARA